MVAGPRAPGSSTNNPVVVDRRLAVLALGAFVVASDGTLIVGLLRQIAHSLSVSPASAGQAVTVFAAVYALGGPLLIRAARRLATRRLLWGTLGVFAIANAATAAAPSFGALLIARVVAAASAGVYMPTAAAAAAAWVGRDRRTRALAVVVGGASAATALGVPLGTFVGGVLGWRTVFYAIAALTALLTVASVRSHPSTQHAPAPMQLVGRRPAVPLILLTTLLWATGSFVFFTYVGVVLHETASAGAAGLAGFLFVFGIAGVAGAAGSGWLSDARDPLVALAGGLVLVALSLAALGVVASAAPGGTVGVFASGAAIVAYGVGTWAITPPQQRRLIARGGDERLLLSLNASALYAGVALGSAAGGLTLAAGAGTAVLCWIAAGMEVAALALVAAARSRGKGLALAEAGGVARSPNASSTEF